MLQARLNNIINEQKTYASDMFSFVRHNALSMLIYAPVIADTKDSYKDETGGRLRCQSDITTSDHFYGNRLKVNTDRRFFNAKIWIRSSMEERPTVNREVVGSSPTVSV